MASGSIYQLLQSPTDQRARRMQVSALADESAMRRMQMQQAQQAADDERAIRELAPQAGGDMGRLSDLLTARGLYKPAQAIRQQQLAAADTQSKIDERRASVGKTQAETLIKNIGIARDELARVGDDEGYQRWARIAGALLPPEMMQGIPQAFDPAWRDRTVMTADEVLARSRPKVEVVNRGGTLDIVNLNDPAMVGQSMPVTMTPAQRQSAINDPFVLGPNGEPVPNQPVQNFQQAKAREGATRVNVPVSVNTERNLLGKIADIVGTQVTDAAERARASLGTISTLDQISSALDSGKVMAGPGTTARVWLGQVGQVLGVGGKNEVERLNNTRQVIQGLAKLELDSAQAMRGQGAITEAERGIIRRAALGEINDMTVPEMRLLIGVIERSARNNIRSHRSNVERLRQQPNAAPVVPFLDSITEPPPRAPAGAPALPPGFQADR